MNMTIDYAIKNNKAQEIAMDIYKLSDSRTIKYDRFCKSNYRWRCEIEHLAYKNFSDCYYDVCAKEF